MKLTVLGGGNGSLAAALDMVELQHDVCLWRRYPADVETMRSHDNGITLKDFKSERVVQIPRIEHDIAAAIEGAELIVCPAPANAQEDIAARLAPHLVDGQVVFLPPGTLGSYLMAKIVSDSGNKAAVTFAEAGTLPYLTRKHGDNAVAITTRATRLPTGVFPLSRKTHALEVIRKAFPSVEDTGNGLSGALMNAGPIIHPPLILMNAGPIQHFAEDGRHWDIHNEGTQPAIRCVTDQLDAERVAVREALGFSAPHFPLADHYDAKREEWMYGNLAHDKLVDSGDWREPLVLTEHRYMREDVELGLALLVSMADWAGVAAPVATGLLSIGSAICETDFRQHGRTMESLGLADLSPEQAAQLFETGF